MRLNIIAGGRDIFPNRLLHPAVRFDYDFRRIFLTADRKLDSVSPRIDWWPHTEQGGETSAAASSPAASSPTTAERSWKVSRARRRFAAQIPLHSIDPNFFCRCQCADDFA